ncbi:hypothetical protein BpHYR1_024266 [Brachionus plicatilis]|uniref:Uncharacterized protein n=1 Tax=Brachionus plicatilis TaxID=10195 RepID=A0A3M7P7L1_BRAPC|nr:hypothetical protein BpHYR1_024266 [Brachionus plicatilis]
MLSIKPPYIFKNAYQHDIEHGELLRKSLALNFVLSKGIRFLNYLPIEESKCMQNYSEAHYFLIHKAQNKTLYALAKLGIWRSDAANLCIECDKMK